MEDILDKIRAWKMATANRDICRSALNKAECDVSNTAIAVMNALVPADYKVGEVFCVPFEKEFIQIEILEGNNCTLTVRKSKK